MHFEIDITDFTDNAFPFSHSVMEGGNMAPHDTWKAAKACAFKPLDTPEKRKAFSQVLIDMGYGETPENSELDALFVQLIAGDIREAGADTLQEIDWEQYQADSEAGQVAGNMFRAEDGRIYYTLDPMP